MYDYLERRLDDGYFYSRWRHEHSGTSSLVYVFSSAYCRREFRFRCPSLCRLYLWRPREASPPTFAPYWRIRAHRSRPIWSFGVENSPTSFPLSPFTDLPLSPLPRRFPASRKNPATYLRLNSPTELYPRVYSPTSGNVSL